MGQVEGHEITTVEGLATRPPICDRLQKSFLRHGAAQCGACTPGMLVSATALLEKLCTVQTKSSMHSVACSAAAPAIAKLLPPCSMPAGSDSPEVSPHAGHAVGKRLVRLDGKGKVNGVPRFLAPTKFRLTRSSSKRFEVHTLELASASVTCDVFTAAHPGIVRILTAKDIPGENCYGVIGRFADQPVFTEVEARFRGEAVAAVSRRCRGDGTIWTSQIFR